MLKNKTFFKSIAVALIMFMMVAALSPGVGMVYAISGSNGATGTTDVNYEVDQTGWTFSVPAAQTFTEGNLTLYGNVSISPESGKDIISLPSGQTINMTFTAANFNDGVFELRNGSNSVIPYKIGQVTRIASEGVSEEVSDITSNGCTVLTYIAGSSANTGVTNKLRFATTLDNIKNAKVTGLHTDIITFTVNVNGLQTATVEGKYIVVDDVNESTHNLNVTLTSDTVTDFSDVKVTRYGSNLLDVSQLLNDDFVDNGDGTYTLTRSGGGQTYTAKATIYIPAGTPFVPLADVIENTISGNKRMVIYMHHPDGTRTTSEAISDDKASGVERIITADKDIIGIQFSDSHVQTEPGEHITLQNLRINIGYKQSYEDYVPAQTVTASADGTVEGLTAVSSNMTIFADNSDVNISCNYQKKN